MAYALASRISCGDQVSLAKAEVARSATVLRYTVFGPPNGCEPPDPRNLPAPPALKQDVCVPPGRLPAEAPGGWERQDGTPARFLESSRPRGAGAFF